VTFGLEPVTAIIMLAGIFYGAQYGGTITSVLRAFPARLHRWSRSSTATPCPTRQSRHSPRHRGHRVVHRRHPVRPRPHLVAPRRRRFALDFGPPEYTALALLGILLVATVSSGSHLKALIAATIGLLLATVGRDGFVSAERFTFENLSLAGRTGLRTHRNGSVRLGEILYNLEERHRAAQPPAPINKSGPAAPTCAGKRRHRPRWPDRLCSRHPARRGSGPVLTGCLRAGKAPLASSRSGSATVQSKASPPPKPPTRSRHIVVHPAAVAGIPSNATMAVIFGALLIQGLTPGRSSSPKNPSCSGASSTRCTSATSCCSS
jgi:putative tricarboxylic transport membrane protein